MQSLKKIHTWAQMQLPLCKISSVKLGGTKCGVFAIAFAMALSFCLNPTKLIFDQSKMRTHLITCLSQKKIQASHLVLIQIGKKENK